jgi:hypothetical protein
MKEIVSSLSEAVSTTLADVGGHKPTVMGEIDGFEVGLSGDIELRDEKCG